MAIVEIAIFVNAMAQSIHCIHPRNALGAVVGGRAIVQAVTIVSDLLDAVDQRLGEIAKWGHDDDLVEVRVAFDALAIRILGHAGVEHIVGLEQTIEGSNGAVCVVGQLVARVARSAGPRVGVVGLAEGRHRHAVELEVEVVPLRTRLTNAELVLFAVRVSGLRNALPQLPELK